MKITKESTVEQVLQKYPASLQLLQSVNIDPTADSNKLLDEVCRTNSIDTDGFITMLAGLYGCGDCSDCGCA